MTSFRVGGPGSAVPFDKTLLQPAMRYIWPNSSTTNVNSAVDSEGMDMAGMNRALWTLNGAPQSRHSTVAGMRIARFGKSNIETDSDQSVDNINSNTLAWLGLAQPVANSGALLPSQRLWYMRLSIALASAALSLGNKTGITFRFKRVGVGWWQPETGNVDRNGFGLVGNGVGQWAWKSKVDDGGTLLPFTEVVNITWPIVVTEFLPVTFVLLAATISQPAKIQMWLADKLTIEREWLPDGSSAILPSQLGSPELAGGLMVRVGCDGIVSSGQELHMRDCEFGQGAVHPITGELATGL